MPGPGLLLGPMSGFVSLRQLRSLLMSMAHNTSKDLEDRAVKT